MFYLMHQENLLVLLALGVLGVCWELCRAPLIVPGVVGSVCIVVALASPASRTFDVWGLALVALSLVCFAAEAAVRSRGLLTVGGWLAMMCGVRLMDAGLGWGIPLLTTIPMSLLISFLLSVAFEARRSKLGILEKGDTAH